jgi:hypothetical protein
MRKRLLIIGILVIFLFVGFSGCQDNNNNNNNNIVSYQLTTSIFKDEDPILMQDSNDVYWSAWCSNRSGNGDIWISYSSDMMNWSQSNQATISQYDDWYPTLIQDSNNTFWLSWMSWRKQNYDVWCSFSDDGLNWSNPIQVTTNISLDWVPYFMQDSSDVYWVVFSSDRLGNKDIYSCSSDNGINWSTPMQLTFDSSEDDCPCLFQDDNDVYHLLWHSNKNGKSDILHTFSNDGISWSNPSILTNENNNDMFPFMIQDQADNYLMIYTSDESDPFGDILYRTSADGITWSSAVRFTTSNLRDYSPKILIDSSEDLWVIWVSDRSGNLDIWYSKIGAKINIT